MEQLGNIQTQSVLISLVHLQGFSCILRLNRHLPLLLWRLPAIATRLVVMQQDTFHSHIQWKIKTITRDREVFKKYRIKQRNVYYLRTIFLLFYQKQILGLFWPRSQERWQSHQRSDALTEAIKHTCSYTAWQ